MGDGAGSFGHGHKVDRRSLDPPADVCARVHPIIADAYCHRKPGHPGPCRAEVVDVTLEWGDEGGDAG